MKSMYATCEEHTAYPLLDIRRRINTWKDSLSIVELVEIRSIKIGQYTVSEALQSKPKSAVEGIQCIKLLSCVILKILSPIQVVKIHEEYGISLFNNSRI